MRNGWMCLGLAFLLFPAACERQVASPPFIAKDVGSGDVSFITYSYNVIQLDFDEGQLALMRSTDPSVKEIAAYLIEKAGEYRGMIAPAADRAGIQPPNELTTNLEQRMDRLRALSGIEFDRAYIADQIASHQEAFDHATSMIGETIDPDINRLVRRSIVQLATDLERLRAIQRRLG